MARRREPLPRILKHSNAGAATQLQTLTPPPVIKLVTESPVPDDPSSPGPNPHRRGTTIIAAGLLLAALALVVLYTGRGAFLSPLALVVVAAIGVAALLLQLRLRPDLSSVRASSARGPLWLNALGVVCALGALFADVLHLDATVIALAAVVSFAVAGIIVLNALRKYRS
jgi:hypothetical protein